MRPLVRTGPAVAMLVAALAAAIVVTATPAGATPAKRPHPFRKPWPITMTIQTVPQLSGLRFTVDGVPLRTDAAGRAAFTEEHNFRAHTLALVDTVVGTPQRRYRFNRWAGQRDPDQAFRPTVTGLPMRANYTVTAAFSVQYPVTARFVDEHGRPVDLRRISAVKIKSSSGALLDLPKAGTIWLDGLLPSYSKSTLRNRAVAYTLQSVMVDGANTVDTGRQKLQPTTMDRPVFTTKFYGLTVRAHDAMFHGRVGRRALVTYPDGTVRTVPLGRNHSVTLENLARGPYAVTVRGGRGVVASEQLVLSRDNTADITVVGVRDLAAMAAVVVLLAAGLLLVGRARLRRLLLTRVFRRSRLESSTI